MAHKTPIGVAYRDQDIEGADKVLSSGDLGFTSDARGAVTQATSKSTGVTLNKQAGVITMNNASLDTATNVSFTLTNSKIGAYDTISVSIADSGATPGAYQAWVTAVAAGSATITVRNITAGALGEAVKLNFGVIKAK